MKKLFISLLFVFILCGCSADYKLNIDSDNIEEVVTFAIPKDSIISEEEDLESSSVYSINSVNYLKSSDIKAVTNDKDAIYERKFNETDSIYNIELKYNYLNSQLEDSTVLTSCFENHDIKVDNDSIIINLSGKFTCFSNEDESLNFVINTSNKVNSSNLETGIFKNEYKWIIDNSNKDNVNIEINISKTNRLFYYVTRIIIGAVVIGIIVGALVVIYKISKAKKENAI